VKDLRYKQIQHTKSEFKKTFEQAIRRKCQAGKCPMRADHRACHKDDDFL
jgi:hypothetical protein